MASPKPQSPPNASVTPRERMFLVVCSKFVQQRNRGRILHLKRSIVQQMRSYAVLTVSIRPRSSACFSPPFEWLGRSLRPKQIATDGDGGALCEREKRSPLRSKAFKQMLITRWLTSIAGRGVCNQTSASLSSASHSRRALACGALPKRAMR
jgi:hypothetical protein